MKNITFLRYAIIVSIFLLIFGIFTNLYLAFNNILEVEKKTFIIINILSFLFIAGLFFIQKALSHFSKREFFTEQSIKYLKTSGYLFILFSLSCMVYNTSYFSSNETLIINLIMYTLILFIGLGLICFSNIIKEGKNLKQENELTI